GGIGAGKTTVSKLFKQLGAPVIDCDEIAHHITEPNTPLHKTIIDRFGKSILMHDGRLDRKKLRLIIFSNDKEKKWLENLLHPVIMTTLQDKIARLNAPYCLLVIPLLTESVSKFHFLHRICVIDTPEEIQIERTKKRDDTSASVVKKIIASQASRKQRRDIADDLLYNEGDLTSLKTQVEALHNKYLGTSATPG
ncbi:unnamed protein product, partial [marine sediment metagenome]